MYCCIQDNTYLKWKAVFVSLMIFLPFFAVMGDLASFITAVFPGCKIQPVMDVLEGLTVEDLVLI